MRTQFVVLFIIAVLFGGTFWYTHIEIPCDTPISYRIGTIDPRFNIERTEVEAMLKKAEAVWEVPLQAELFNLDHEGELVVNFIYDERQALSNSEVELRQDLEAKEGMSEAVAEQYQELISEFRKLKNQYEARVVSYESALKTYNDEVRAWNEAGGAPEEERSALAARAETLASEQATLESQARRLNTITGELNRIGARGNTIIADYNSIVDEYNAEFSDSREFAQGDYTGDAINIYEFTSEEELIIVLAHELGHALSIGHVDGEGSIMYHLMEDQDIARGLTPEDTQAFANTCTNRGTVATLIRTVRTFFF